MKIAHSILLLFICIACTSSTTVMPHIAHMNKHVPQPIVSIPLTKHTHAFLCISSKNAITVTRATSGKRSTEQSIYISVHDHIVALNGQSASHETFVLSTPDSQLTIQGKLYAGPATIEISPTQVRITARTISPYTADKVWNVKQEQKGQQKSHIIQVLIGELPYQKNQSEPLFTLHCDSGFIVYDPLKPHNRWMYEKTMLTISFNQGSLMINRRPYAEHKLYIVPQNGYACVGNQCYQGMFSIIQNPEHLLLINHIDLEEYVHSVLKTESWPGWPLEVNKVFAIASRSYVMAIAEQTKSKHLPYHIKNTTEHQTYTGMHSCPVIRTAVEQTRGIILAYQEKPALTMFDACCGGIIPARIGDFSFDKAPYLARPYACTHCQRCKIYSWSAHVTPEELSKKIKNIYQTNDPLEKIHILKKDGAGLVQKLVFQHKNMKKILTGKQLYYSLPGIIKSLCFTTKKQDEKIIIQGKGFGHHIGLCQWGAREMVRDGWNYKRILSFYYPGTQLVRLV